MIPQRILLDTNAFLALVAEPQRIAPSVREILAAEATEIAVSAASAWEISIKTGAGKLPGGRTVLATWDILVADLCAGTFDISVADAIAAGGLPWHHRDPFDRVLVAQASSRGYRLATSDSVILRDAPVPTLDTRR